MKRGLTPAAPEVPLIKETRVIWIHSSKIIKKKLHHLFPKPSPVDLILYRGENTLFTVKM